MGLLTRYTNIITLVCIQTVKKQSNGVCPWYVMCHLFSHDMWCVFFAHDMWCVVFQYSKKKSTIFSYRRSVENVPSKKYPNAVDHMHLWKILYFKGCHKYPQFYNGWGTILEHRNFMEPMGRLSMHSKCLDFFNFGARVGGDFFHFSFVPNMFLSSSQCVPQGCSQ
jgi:hypothetical protein